VCVFLTLDKDNQLPSSGEMRHGGNSSTVFN